MKLPKTPEIDAQLKAMRRAFKKKFGRYPKPGEPIFFDPDADTPQPMKPAKMEADMLAVMKAAGTPAVIIYAYKKTGLLLMEEHLDRYPAESVREWNAAIDEYYALEEQHAAKADTPKQKLRRQVPPTEIEALQANPLTDDDMQAIFKCFDALDTVLAVTPMTVRARMEMGSALVALACASAFDSAIDQGGTADDGHTRAAVFASLAMDRAQEIYESMDVEGDETDNE